MHVSSGRLVGALGAVALLASACTPGGAQANDDPTTASPTVEATGAPTPSATASSPSDPFAMPDPVTEEYVDRVVNTIYEEWGAITREILEQPADPTAITSVETRERVAAIFAGPELQGSLTELDQILRGDREGLKPPDDFGSVQWRSRAIFTASDRCLIVAGDFDTSQTAATGRSLLSALSLVPVTDDRTDGNPTGWKILDSLANTGEGGEVFDDEVMLKASLGDLGEFMEMSCGE